jgi:glycosyltransferase involved in cell wall biosynthesis
MSFSDGNSETRLPELVEQGLELVCLLCVRDGERALPGFLDAVAKLADAVVAVDDGSVDRTATILKEHPLVKAQLARPRSAGVASADEADNRNRLLDAAATLRPRWILCLDVDERISEQDAIVLREFLRDGAIRGAAYGFRVSPANCAREAESEDGAWSYRLFAYRVGQRFPRIGPHDARVPTDFPREHWVKTTIEIQKQDGPLRPDRHAGLAVVENSADTARPLADPGIRRSFDRALDPDRPVMSAVVISMNDRDRIKEVMDALVSQKVDQPVEFILVNSGRDGTAELVRHDYPQVRVVHLPAPALPGKARNAGLAVARGDFITFPGSHIVLPPGALQKRIDAHEAGYAMTCGAVLNGTDTRAGWASYFLDHAVALPGRPSRLLGLPPSRCSYMRGPLEAIGGFPEDRRVGEDTVVNTRLFELGYRSYYSSDIRCIHKTPCKTVARLLHHHFERGLGFGRILWEQAGRPKSLNARGATILWLMTKYPVRRTRFIKEAVREWGEPVRREFVRSFPLVVAGVAGAAVGAILFLLRPRAAGASASLAANRSRVSRP